MTVNKKIIDFLFVNDVIQTTKPSTRDVANGIVRMYEVVAEYIKDRHYPHPSLMMDYIRFRIRMDLGVDEWEDDIEPILKVIGFDWQAELGIVMQYWHPGLIPHP